MKLPLLLASALTLLPAFDFPLHPIASSEARPADGDLTGTYECEGVKPDGVAYRGTVQIARYNGTYHLRWTFSPQEQYVGIGIATGNVLSVSYFGTEPGVVVYEIEQREKGPRLVGHWTVVQADGQVFGETLTQVTKEVTDVAPPPPPTPQRKPGPLVLSRSARSA